MPSVRAASVLALLGGILAQCRAQCTIGTLPADTQFVEGQDASCAEAGVMEEDAVCTVECLAGNSQGPGGTYDFECGADGALTDPVPTCVACGLGEWQSEPGQAACNTCPLESTTEDEGSVDPSTCLCNPGHTGDIVVGDETCEPCALGEYKAATGPAACTPCPDDSTTEETAQVAPTACLCTPGHTGEIIVGDETCEECELGQYKAATGPAACTPCPDDSTTEETAQVAPTACLCTPGHTGEITVGDETCEECEADTYKTDLGPDECTSCPDNSNTAEGESGATAPSACICDAENGWQGEIISPADLCRQDPEIGTGLVVLLVVASGLGATSAAAGVLYFKGGYNRADANDWSGGGGGRSGRLSDPLIRGQASRFGGAE